MLMSCQFRQVLHPAATIRAHGFAVSLFPKYAGHEQVLVQRLYDAQVRVTAMLARARRTQL